MIEWKDIPDFDGYQVSSTGLVRTHNKITSNRRYGERHWKDRILVPKVGINKNNRGDKRVDLWKDGKPHTKKISRLVAFTFFEMNINDASLTVNHIDGDFNNNDISNLEIITLKENINHGFDTGLYSNSRSVVVIDKRTGEEKRCRSIAQASKYVGKSGGYVWYLVKNSIHEDEYYTYVY